MKKTAFLFVLIFTSSFFTQQKYYTFSELKGIEDNSGNTHLFYRLYTYQKNGEPFADYIENSIHNLDLYSGKDTLFLWDGQDFNYRSTGILDLEFWNNNPSEYIYCGFIAILDPETIIKRFDEKSTSYNKLGTAENLEISKQNDSLVFAAANRNVLVSYDGARNWDTINTLMGKEFISLNPFNDSILFLQDNNKLFKSIDRGVSYSIVDTTFTDYKFFKYDNDGNHIYRLTFSYPYNYLSVSSNQGNAFSWAKRFSDTSKIFISVDYSQAGTIYLSNRKNIFVSTNYGESFSLIKTLKRYIIGIYKKPNSNLLYAATKYDLYEISPDTIKILKHLAVNPDILTFYPLKKGNKWIYDDWSCNFLPSWVCDHRIVTRSVIGDTIMPNNKKYFIIKSNYNSYDSYYNLYERIDSLNAKIYRYNLNKNKNSDEYLIDDLISEINDTLNSFRYGYEGKTLYKGDGVFNKWNLTETQKEFEDLESLTPHQYNLVQSIGLDSIIFSYDFGNTQAILKGCIINGKVYGDTILVGVDGKENNLSIQFSLSQNYPNPFNPTTKIKYSIPFVETHRNASVQLKVYDILGNEIATLVNKERSPGEYEVEFDAGKYNLSSGIYFYQLKTGNFIQTKKLVLLK